ncbi:MAG: YceI family protein [Henriciella sp.]|nr:YceI family protein [Henriciella sp.]
MRLVKTMSGAVAALALASCGAPDNGSAAGGSEVQLSDIQGAWSLDSSASRIAFASIKSGELIETHFFPGLTGEVAETGETVITVPLDQVETKIEQRNERMQTLFFQTETYPTAEIRATVEKDAYAALPVGGRLETELEGTLSLHGIDAAVYANVFVTRIAPTRMEVATSEPVVVYVADHNLEAGLEALRDVANLPSITPAVPVTFTLVFEATADQ